MLLDTIDTRLIGYGIKIDWNFYLEVEKWFNIRRCSAVKASTEAWQSFDRIRSHHLNSTWKVFQACNVNVAKMVDFVAANKVSVIGLG